MERVTRVEISPKSVLLILAVILSLFLAWKLQSIIAALVISFILMSGLAPLVDYLNSNLGIRKGPSILVTYIIAVIVIAVLAFLVIPPLVAQVVDLFYQLPNYYSRASETLGFASNPTQVRDYSQSIVDFTTNRLDTISSQALRITTGVFSGIFAFITVMVLTFFLLLEREKIKENVFLIMPHLPKHRSTRLAHEIEKKLGAWFIGQLTLGFIIGFTTFIGLAILGVPYAVPLAVIAGVMELVPVIGPILSAIPAIIIALVVSPTLALFVGAFYLIVQQVENSILVPKVMEKAVGLSPIITILALLAGSALFGVIGAILAVPVTAALKVVYEDYLENGLDGKK